MVWEYTVNILLSLFSLINRIHKVVELKIKLRCYLLLLLVLLYASFFPEPSKPHTVSVTSQETNGLTLTWKAGEGSVGTFTITVNPMVTGVNIDDPVMNSHGWSAIVTGLSPGEKYTFSISPSIGTGQNLEFGESASDDFYTSMSDIYISVNH